MRCRVARLSQEREDLMNEAVALVPRSMLRVTISGNTCEVFAGFRGECLSLYFGSDPVYHFNSRGELRRAFAKDRIVKAVEGKLVIWQPDRQPHEVTMRSRPMEQGELADFGNEFSRRLDDLRRSLEQHSFEVVGEFPAESDIVRRLAAWLDHNESLRIAKVANVS